MQYILEQKTALSKFLTLSFHEMQAAAVCIFTQKSVIVRCLNHANKVYTHIKRKHWMQKRFLGFHRFSFEYARQTPIFVPAKNVWRQTRTKRDAGATKHQTEVVDLINDICSKTWIALISETRHALDNGKERICALCRAIYPRFVFTTLINKK